METERSIKSQKRFKVVKPTTRSWLIYSFLIILLSTGYLFIFFQGLNQLLLPESIDVEFQLDEIFWGLLVPNIVMIIVSPIIWDRISNAILTKKWVQSYSKSRLTTKRKPQPLKALLGIKPRPEYDYYLELDHINTDLNEVALIFKNKLLGAISGSIGVTFVGASILNLLLISDTSELLSKDILFLSTMLMQIIPLIISFIVPVNWTLYDVALRYKDDKNFVKDVGDDMSNGIFRKLIGVGGLLLGVNVCYNLAYNKSSPWFLNGWVTLIYFVFFFLLLNAGTILMISLSYLLNFHEIKVNKLRTYFSNSIPLGKTNVDQNAIDYKEDLTKEISSNFERKKSNRVWQTIIVIILLILAIFGEFYVLFIVGPFQPL